MDATDIGQVVELADLNRTVLDAVGEPRLLNGDLWVGNLMIARGAPVPTIVGVLDCDRIWWGDPEADWPIYLAQRQPGAERDAFWETYGHVGTAPEAFWRRLLYRVRHAVGLRLEYQRSGMNEKTAETYIEVRELIAQLNKLAS